MNNTLLIVILSGFLYTFQSATTIIDMEASLTAKNKKTWIYIESIKDMALAEEPPTVTFILSSHSYVSENEQDSLHLRGAVFKEQGKWKIFTHDNIEYFLIIDSDTLNMEIGSTMDGRARLILTRISHHQEDPSYIDFYYEEVK